MYLKLTQDQSPDSTCRTKTGSGYRGTDLLPSGMQEFTCKQDTRSGCDCGYSSCITHSDTFEYSGDSNCSSGCKLVRSGKNADSDKIKGMHTCEGRAGWATYEYKCYRSSLTSW